MKPDYDSTLNYVIAVFGDIKDKAGIPYINHLKFVADNVESDEEEVKMIALLHDIIEDTVCTAESLSEMGYSDRVVSGVVAMTKLKVGDRKTINEPYKKYLDRVKANPDAVLVKLADLKHNSDLSRLKPEDIGVYELKRHAKYRDAVLYLAYNIHRWKVVGDHPVLRRPDKTFFMKNQADEFVKELIDLGYENVKVSEV